MSPNVDPVDFMISWPPLFSSSGADPGFISSGRGANHQGWGWCGWVQSLFVPNCPENSVKLEILSAMGHAEISSIMFIHHCFWIRPINSCLTPLPTTQAALSIFFSNKLKSTLNGKRINKPLECTATSLLLMLFVLKF